MDPVSAKLCLPSFAINLTSIVCQITLNLNLTDGYKRWRVMTYVICFPAVALATFVNFGPTATHEHRPEFKPYEYMRVRSKVNLRFDEKLRTNN